MKSIKDGMLRFAAFILSVFTLGFGLVLLEQIGTALQRFSVFFSATTAPESQMPFLEGLFESFFLAAGPVVLPSLISLTLGITSCALMLKAWRAASAP